MLVAQSLIKLNQVSKEEKELQKKDLPMREERKGKK